MVFAPKEECRYWVIPDGSWLDIYALFHHGQTLLAVF